MIEQRVHVLDKKKAGSHLLSRDGPSIIGAGELDFRVRNGNGYFLPAMATGINVSHAFQAPARRSNPPGTRASVHRKTKALGLPLRGKRQYGQASRPISNARLSASPRLHLHPINPVFSRGPSDGIVSRSDVSSRGGLPA